jgi:hypothetical protein
MIATWAAELMVHRIVALELASPSVLPAPVPVTALGVQVNKGFSSRVLAPSGLGGSDGNNSKLIASAVSDFKDFLRSYKYVRTSIYFKAHGIVSSTSHPVHPALHLPSFFSLS